MSAALIVAITGLVTAIGGSVAGIIVALRAGNKADAAMKSAAVSATAAAKSLNIIQTRANHPK